MFSLLCIEKLLAIAPSPDLRQDRRRQSRDTTRLCELADPIAGREGLERKKDVLKDAAAEILECGQR